MFRLKENQIYLTYALAIIVHLNSYLEPLSTLLQLTFGQLVVCWPNCFLDRLVLTTVNYARVLLHILKQLIIVSSSLCFLERVELISWLRLSRWCICYLCTWKLFFAIILFFLKMKTFSSILFCPFWQVLGTPTREEIKCMNPNYTEYRFPQIKAHPWHKVKSCFCGLCFCFVNFAADFEYMFVFRYSPSVCLQKQWILSQDFFSILLTCDALLWVTLIF